MYNRIHLHPKDTICGPKCLFGIPTIPQKNGQPLLKGQKPSPQCVLYLEVPLWTTDFVDSILVVHNFYPFVPAHISCLSPLPVIH